MPFLVIALAGVGVWGYQENQEKNSILIKAENQYQRAFHDLTYHINKLEEELSKSIVINSRGQRVPNMATIWRLSYAAQSDVGQLPLTLMPFNKTEEFLSNMADFSYQVAIRDLNENPLTEQEWSTLRELHKRARDIQKELDNVQSKVLAKNLRWMDVETALATEDKQMDNTIVDGFRTVDKRVGEYKELNWGTSITSIEQRKKDGIKNIKGKEISRTEAKQVALKFLGINDQSVNVEVDENGKGTEYSSYSVTIKKEDGDPIHLDVTKKGGHVVWLLNEREINQPSLSFNQAREKAMQFLRRHGYDAMEFSASDQYEQLAVFTAVHKQGDVRIYPDAVTVKVALDNGEVTGFQAEKYMLYHVKRDIAEPELTRKEALDKIHHKLNVRESRLSLIENGMGEEVLCYEFIGTMGNKTYRVFINASDGSEEEIEVLKDVRL